MIETTLVGSGGTLPTALRPLTSLFLKIKYSGILMDCGEGTQTSFRELKKRMLSVDVVCITHRHADHILGLPGFLVTMNQLLIDTKSKKDISVIAPEDARDTIESLLSKMDLHHLCIAFMWIEEEKETFMFPEFTIEAFRMEHSASCYGYAVTEKNIGHFDREAARKCEVNEKQWGLLQAGYVMTTPSGVWDVKSVNTNLVDDLKVCYATDTSMCENLRELLRNADLAVVEGMYYNEKQIGSYPNLKHLTFREAIETAKSCGAKSVWLTHFSPTVCNPWAGIAELAEQGVDVSNVECGKKGMHTEVNFSDVLEKQRKQHELSQIEKSKQ